MDWKRQFVRLSHPFWRMQITGKNTDQQTPPTPPTNTYLLDEVPYFTGKYVPYEFKANIVVYL